MTENNTLVPIEFDPQTWAKLGFDDFVQQVREKLLSHKNAHFNYFEGQRKKNSGWANNSRSVLAWLGALALLLTGVAAAFRLTPESLVNWSDWDKPVLVAVLVIYAGMTAIAFFEKGTDKTTAYFRHLAVILAIRDLWTKLQFEFLKEASAVNSAADRKAAEGPARERIVALGKAFCDDLNKITAAELTEWKTEFLTSLTELSEAAKKGSEDVTKQIQEITKAAEKAATDAKTAADKATAEAKAAAKSAEDAARPGAINITFSPGDFDEEVVVSIDGAEVGRTRAKTLAIDRVATGTRKIFASSKKSSKGVETSRIIDIKPGIQDVSLTLT